MNSPAGYTEYEVLDGGQLSADQQVQLGQTDLHDLATFHAQVNDPGAVEQAAVDAPSTGKAGFVLCLGAFKLAQAHPHVALGILVVAGVIIIAVRVLNPQPKPRPTPQPITPTPPAPTATPGPLPIFYVYQAKTPAIWGNDATAGSFHSQTGETTGAVC